MIKHVVMWKLSELAENNFKSKNAILIKEMLLELPSKINFIKKLEVGINIDKSEAAYDLVLITEFDNTEDLNNYQQHPEHIKVSQFVQKVRSARCVVDYEF